MQTVDVVIMGGGIIGLATAYRLQQKYPHLKTVVLEKERGLAQHQTGHNSGVLHSGIYYTPGSQKAINCREGKRAMERFCVEQEIALDICGKVIVATETSEVPALERIFHRGQQNGVRCERIGPERLRELEPHAAGIQAIHVPEAGIVDYRQVCQRLGDLIREHGCDILTRAKATNVVRAAGRIEVQTPHESFSARKVINCTGLHSDRLTRLTGVTPQAQIVPFRGEYYQLEPEASSLCRNLIYPVPDPRFPFLGVHFTRTIDGSVECGPNAVLAFAREGYRKRDINLRDLTESLMYKGFQRLAFRYWSVGLHEMWRSVSKRAFVHALQRLIPEIRGDQLRPAASGVRAQAVAPEGSMVDDFLILDDDQVINVCNAPSPAATSSLNIATNIVDRLGDTWS